MSIIASATVPAGSRLIDAPTLNLTAIRRPSADVLELARRVDRLIIGTNLTDDEVAARVGVSADEAFAAYEAFDKYLQAHRPAGCPAYCSQDHRGEVTEVDGFTLGLVHERILAEQTGQDPGWSRNHPATAVVRVESTTEAGAVITPTRVVLTVSEGTEGAYDGEDTEAWTGTPAQARALAAALLAGAELVEGGVR